MYSIINHTLAILAGWVVRFAPRHFSRALSQIAHWYYQVLSPTHPSYPPPSLSFTKRGQCHLFFTMSFSIKSDNVLSSLLMCLVHIMIYFYLWKILEPWSMCAWILVFSCMCQGVLLKILSDIHALFFLYLMWLWEQKQDVRHISTLK